MAELRGTTSVAVEEGGPQSGAAADPFGGDCQQFAWPRDVHVGQLQVEVSEALGEEVRVALVLPRDGAGEPMAASGEHPVQVFVSPSMANAEAVREVMAVHKPDPYYGLPDEERRWRQLQHKARSGADLSMDEIQEALRLMLLP